MSDIVILRRDVDVIVVPYGDQSKLFPGQEAFIMQSMGGNFTLNIMGKLFLLDGKYADAIGRDAIKLPSDNLILKPTDNMNEKLLWNQLKSIYDPEIPVNIVDLGLIYNLNYFLLSSQRYCIDISMTLTSPVCGMGPVLVQTVKNRLKLIANINTVNVKLIFEPAWNYEMMSDIAKIELGLI